MAADNTKDLGYQFGFENTSRTASVAPLKTKSDMLTAAFTQIGKDSAALGRADAQLKSAISNLEAASALLAAKKNNSFFQIKKAAWKAKKAMKGIWNSMTGGTGGNP
jgi:vacuolar-type H+-ATPase subunit D/Vma8